MLTSNLINRLCASPCACGISSHMKVKPFPHGGVKNERPMLSSPVQPDTIQSRYLLLISNVMHCVRYHDRERVVWPYETIYCDL